MHCESKHTKYQPSGKEFCCPKCGAKAGDFCIDEGFGDDDCEDLHEDDYLRCYECGYEVSGRNFAASVVKKNNLVKCPCCRGAGYVPKDKNEKRGKK